MIMVIVENICVIKSMMMELKMAFDGAVSSSEVVIMNYPYFLLILNLKIFLI